LHLKKLKTIDLVGTRVTDKGVNLLLKTFPHLEIKWHPAAHPDKLPPPPPPKISQTSSQTFETEEGIKRLQQVLPGTKIISR
jgi:hypothetical protein